MKKRVVQCVALALALSLLVCIFAGCGAKKNDKNEQGQTMISVGGWPTSGEALDKMNDRKARFDEENPDVALEGDPWTFDRKSFYAKAAGGQLPTVFRAGFTEMPEIINAEYGADLSKVLSKRGYDGKFNQIILDCVSKDGKIYAFPTNVNLLGIAYNTEMFEKAGLMEADGTPKEPKSWDELAEFAVKIKETTGTAGFVFPSAGNLGGWLLTCLAWSYGADFMEQDADGNWKATFDTPEAEKALQFIKDLKWKYDVLPANNLIDSGEYYKVFGSQEAAMMITAGDFPWKVSAYGITADQLGMMGIPAGPKRHVTMLVGDVMCIAGGATEDQIDAALRWIEMEYNYKLTDEFKTNLINKMELWKENNRLMAIKQMSIWADDTETLQYEHQTIDEYTTTNPNHVRLYNEFVANCPCEIQPEEPVCCQELYAILDTCIQEVLTNKDADCAALLKKANSDFQQDYLDNIDY